MKVSKLAGKHLLLVLCLVCFLSACPLSDADLESLLIGTEGLAYVYIPEIEGYRVSAGTVTTGGVVIPAFHDDGSNGLKAVKIIAESGFENLSDITHITIPSTIITINDNAFRNCTGLTELFIPFSVTEVGTDVLTGCTSLYELSAPLKYPYDMNNNSYLKYYFGSSHRYDDVKAPENLKVFHILEGTTEITIDMFRWADQLTTITVPASVTTYEGTSIPFRACLSLEYIIVDEENGSFLSIDGVLFNKHATSIV